MITENSKDHDINEDVLRNLFRTDADEKDTPDTAMSKSDSAFINGVNAGIARKTRKQRLFSMLPAFVFTCALAFLILPNVTLILDAFQFSLPESVSGLLTDLGNSMEFKLGLVLLFGLGLPWLFDKYEQSS